MEVKLADCVSVWLWDRVFLVSSPILASRPVLLNAFMRTEQSRTDGSEVGKIRSVSS